MKTLAKALLAKRLVRKALKKSEYRYEKNIAALAKEQELTQMEFKIHKANTTKMFAQSENKILSAFVLVSAGLACCAVSAEKRA